jgi:peptidoglycan/xylan/chitin deacetylase (PgdA/CDA1 family)
MLLIIFAMVIAVGLAFGLWFWWACATPSSTFFRPVLIRGPQDRKRVSLTFDDGPSLPFTSQILDILREHQVPATFFVCGKKVEQHPDLLRRMVAEGHEIGNHTYSHHFTFFKSRRHLADEIDRTQAVIERVCGRSAHLFRPPYGSRWFGLMPILLKRGMQMVLWSAAGYDWKKNVAGITRATLRELRPGAIILLHDGRETRPVEETDRSQTVKALPGIIAGVQEQGYAFVPLKEFLPST